MHTCRCCAEVPTVQSVAFGYMQRIMIRQGGLLPDAGIGSGGSGNSLRQALPHCVGVCSVKRHHVAAAAAADRTTASHELADQPLRCLLLLCRVRLQPVVSHTAPLKLGGSCAKRGLPCCGAVATVALRTAPPINLFQLRGRCVFQIDFSAWRQASSIFESRAAGRGAGEVQYRMERGFCAREHQPRINAICGMSTCVSDASCPSTRTVQMPISRPKSPK